MHSGQQKFEKFPSDVLSLRMGIIIVLRPIHYVLLRFHFIKYLPLPMSKVNTYCILHKL